MDELVDFEELIDLNLSLPSVSQSSQEPITEVLDKMCEAMDESNLAIDNTKDEKAPDDDIANLDEFEYLFATASFYNNESSLVTDDLLEINDNDMAQILDDDTIDLDEFENISANACLFIDYEDEIDKGNNDISNLKKVSSYAEVPVEFETTACVHKTESDVIKEENITSANNYTLKTISVESTAISSEKEIDNYIDLEAFESGTVNPVSDKLKIVNKEYENGLETVKAECKTETNIAEIIVTLTTNNEKYENGIERSKTDCKNTIDTINEYTDSNSDDDYDPLDFEFISEQEACKAGIVTRMSKTINETKATVTNSTQSTSKNVDNKLSHIEQHCIGQSTSNIDNRLRKNEASLSDYVKYSKYSCYTYCYTRSTSELHVIPEGERYLDMFRGEYAPVVVNNLYSLTNKRVLPAVTMVANFEELAYRDPGVDEENEKYKDDADDCLKKILSAHPRENRRKRRRH